MKGSASASDSSLEHRQQCLKVYLETISGRSAPEDNAATLVALLKREPDIVEEIGKQIAELQISKKLTAASSIDLKEHMRISCHMYDEQKRYLKAFGLDPYASKMQAVQREILRGCCNQSLQLTPSCARKLLKARGTRRLLHDLVME